MDQVSFTLGALDYVAFAAFCLGLSLVGYWAGRRERVGADAYFLAGRKLPWYVVGEFLRGTPAFDAALGPWAKSWAAHAAHVWRASCRAATGHTEITRASQIRRRQLAQKSAECRGGQPGRTP
jgi:hypothetical protein